MQLVIYQNIMGTEFPSTSFLAGSVMKEKKKEWEEPLVQKVMDPTTGRDITGEYISERLEQLEEIAEQIVADALEAYKEDPSQNKAIYEKHYWKIHNKLGMGSIGPATAAAGPLMERMKKKLAESLDVDPKDLI